MRVLAALFRHPSGRIGAVIIALYLVAAVLGAVGITPHNALKQFSIDRLKPPNLNYLMGTDLLGRDTLSRLMLGIGQSFVVAFASVACATLAGTIIGLLAAWWGSLWDGVLMRVMDVLLAFPAILLALLIIAIVGPGTFTSVAAIAIVYTPIFARVARAATLSVRVEPFVQVSRTMGTGHLYMLVRHILPNITGPLIVQTSLSLAFAILSEAALSFLGLGIQPPQPSLGRMIFDSQGFVTLAWWMAVFPGAAIVVAVLAFNLFGDGLRDVLDPKQRTMIEARRRAGADIGGRRRAGADIGGRRRSG